MKPIESFKLSPILEGPILPHFGFVFSSLTSRKSQKIGVKALLATVCAYPDHPRPLLDINLCFLLLLSIFVLNCLAGDEHQSPAAWIL